jgi:hypothetical protein
MKASTIQWHLARDNQISLHKFCEKNRTKQEVTTKPYLFEDGNSYFNITYYFDNGGWIEVELQAGDEKRGYTVADHFQVADYRLEATA